MMIMAVFLEMKDVVKRYGSKLSVDHMNLEVHEGEIFGLLGPNGAGKSTSINMICGLLAKDQGIIKVDGISIDEQPLEVKRRIGLVPQDLALYEEMPAWDNVAFCEIIRAARPTAEGAGGGGAGVCRPAGSGKRKAVHLLRG